MSNIDLAVAYILFASGGYILGNTAGHNGGMLNLFDISESTKNKIRNLDKKITDALFGKSTDVPNKIETYTEKTPDVIKKDSLSAK